jgi:DNA-binding response OmpR family regulator
MALILVIDDDARVRRQVRRILSAARHTVIEAPDGAAGMALLREKHPARVITDIIMPRKDGIETILEIRRVRPNTKVIAVSGGHSEPSDALYLKAPQKLGADAVLAKPFRSAELLNAVEACLRPCY